MKRQHKTRKKSPFNQIRIVSASKVSPKVYFAACVTEAIQSNKREAREREANRLRFDQALREYHNDICKRIESDRKGRKS